MEAITGEKFQNLADISISKVEHRQFESKNFDKPYLDIDNFVPINDTNPYYIYCNNSLINSTKTKLLSSDLYGKLKNLKNKFTLILHNADQDFTDKHIKYLELENCERIYAQSIDITHPKLFPLPMGIANQVWEYSDEKYLMEFIKNLPTKTKLLYFNFSTSGDHRRSQRVNCYSNLTKNKFTENPKLAYRDYIKELSLHKYCACPPGNTLDTYRMYEALYCKVVPICERNKLTEYFANLFPIYLVDDWEQVTERKLIENYTKYTDWSNYSLLDFNNMCNHLKLPVNNV